MVVGARHPAARPRVCAGCAGGGPPPEPSGLRIPKGSVARGRGTPCGCARRSPGGRISSSKRWTRGWGWGCVGGIPSAAVGASITTPNSDRTAFLAAGVSGMRQTRRLGSHRRPGILRARATRSWRKGKRRWISPSHSEARIPSAEGGREEPALESSMAFLSMDAMLGSSAGQRHG